jgi:hypothetical protein
MASPGADDFRLTVLNPAGRDPDQHFDEVPGPGGAEHPPINFHGYAACTRGVFHYDTRRAIGEETPVLLLLRGEFRASERALNELKKHGRKVVVSLKETGLHQIAQQLCDRGRLSRFMRILAQADGCIATTPEAAEIYQRARWQQKPARSHLFRPLIRSKIDDGTFACRPRSKLESLSAPANGTCLRAIISRRSWSPVSSVRRQTNP